MSRNRAFTLVELLVVIGIIALLIGILIPALSKAQQQAKITACLSNMRQLTQGWMMYANDFKGSIPFAETNGERKADGTINTDNKDKRDGWVVDIAGDPGTNTRSSVEKGLLWKYCSAAETYRCPASIDLNHFRSYSINHHLNGTPLIWYPDFYNTGTPPGFAPPPIVTKLSKIKPERIVFIEEFDTFNNSAVNQGSFLQFKGWNPINNSTHRWGDVPAVFHKKGTCMSYADGHAAYYIWSDQRTLKAKNSELQRDNKDIFYIKTASYGDPNNPKSDY